MTPPIGRAPQRTQARGQVSLIDSVVDGHGRTLSEMCMTRGFFHGLAAAASTLYVAGSFDCAQGHAWKRPV